MEGTPQPWASAPPAPPSFDAPVEPPVEPPKKKHRLIIAAVVAASLVAAGAVGWLVSGGSSDSSRPSATHSSSGGSSSMAAWASDNDIMGKLDTLTSDVQSIVTDSRAEDVESLSIDCSSWASDISDFQDALPSPNSDFNRAEGAALDSFATAAQECQDGADNYDGSLLSAAAADIRTGTTYMNEATAIVKSLGAN